MNFSVLEIGFPLKDTSAIKRSDLEISFIKTIASIAFLFSFAVNFKPWICCGFTISIQTSFQMPLIS